MSSTTTTWSTDTNTKSGSATTYTDTVSSLRLVGGEGEDAILRLFADEGDDNADHWRIVSQASTNKLNFMSLASGSWSNVMSLLGSGTASSVYLALPAASKLYLDGAGGTTYLQESSDGHLEINSGTTLDLTAPTVDLNSSTEFNIDTAAYDLNASGAVTLDGATVTIKGTGASKYGDDTATLDFDGSGAVSETGMTSCSITPSGAITLTAGATSTWSTSAGDLSVTSAGNLNLTSTVDEANSIYIRENAGTSGTIKIHADQGTGADSISLVSDGGGITMTLGGGAGDDFIVDTNTLVVESDNNRVGIGTASPVAGRRLTISGAGGSSPNGAGGLHIETTGGSASGGLDIFATSTGANPVWDIRTFASEEISFSPAGTERIRFDASGNVGIGTTDPRVALELGTYAAVPFAGNLAVGSDANHVAIALCEVSGGTEQYGIGVNTGGDLQFHDSAAGTVTMCIQDVTGNVGIGTPSPTALLHIDGGTDAVPHVSDDTVLPILRLEPTGVNMVLDFGYAAAGVTDVGWIQSRNKDYSVGTALLALNPNGGKVGIGTTAPDAALHIFKDLDGVATSAPDASESYQLFINGAAGTTGDTVGIGFGCTNNNDNVTASIVARRTATAAGTGDLDFYTQGAADMVRAMTIDEDQKVGIGTTSIDCLFHVESTFQTLIAKIESTHDTVTSAAVLLDLDFSNDSDVTDGIFCRFQDSDGEIGSIDAANATTVAFNTSSDYRLKEDLKDMSGATDTINKLKLYNFQWKKDGVRSDGLIAHEIMDVYPQPVSGEKDAMTTKKYTISPAIEGVDAVEAVVAKDAVLNDDGDIVEPAIEAVEAVEAVEGVEEVTGVRDIIAPQMVDYSKFVPLLLLSLIHI